MKYILQNYLGIIILAIIINSRIVYVGVASVREGPVEDAIVFIKVHISKLVMWTFNHVENENIVRSPAGKKYNYSVI